MTQQLNDQKTAVPTAKQVTAMALEATRTAARSRLMPDTEMMTRKEWWLDAQGWLGSICMRAVVLNPCLSRLWMKLERWRVRGGVKSR